MNDETRDQAWFERSCAEVNRQYDLQKAKVVAIYGGEGNEAERGRNAALGYLAHLYYVAEYKRQTADNPSGA